MFGGTPIRMQQSTQSSPTHVLVEQSGDAVFLINRIKSGLCIDVYFQQAKQSSSFVCIYIYSVYWLRECKVYM